MGSTKLPLFATISIFLLLVLDLARGDLPSCQRAKCSHCQVQFIARMCPNACRPCFTSSDDCNQSDTHSSIQEPVVQTKVVSYGQTAFVPNNQQANTIQQTIPNNAGNGPPVLQQASIQQPQNYRTSQAVVQPQPYQQPYQPTNTFQGTHVSNVVNPYARPTAPQTPAVSPYQQVSGFGSPYGASSSSFFNPFLPGQSFPLGGLTFVPPLAPAAFTPSPLLVPQTLPPPIPPVLQPIPPASQQSVPPYQPYQPTSQSASQPQPSPQTSYSQGQPYRPQTTGQQTAIYQTKETGAIKTPAVPSSQYITNGNGQPQGRYATNSNSIYATGQGQQQKYVPSSYSQLTKPKQIHSTQSSRGSVSVPQAPQPQPSYVQPAPSLPQPNPSAQGLPIAVTIKPQPPLLPSEPLTNNNIPIESHIDSLATKVEKATCPRQPNWEPCISKELANERFRNCCQRLGEGCAQLCSYDQNLATLQIAVLTGRCPIGKVADMMICASGYEDATPCCEANGVFDPGFAHCRPYCNPAAGLPNDGMIAEKYRCLAKLTQIQRCFYVTQRP